jgi:hypothetical protein
MTFRTAQRVMPAICEDCGSVLTDTERHYYERRCEQCESAWSERMTAWQKGAEDDEMDALYSVPKRGALH